MADKKFSIVHDLGSLSEEQRKQYLSEASEFFGLDPHLNGLDIFWIDSIDGMRRLVAYARRGTTDILRNVHGITVSSLEQHDGPGYVSFKATGTNRDGRQEIAVGASAIEGLRGDRLAAAIATAQTRALRRLTLQFVGGGLLDESEVNQSTTDINRAPGPLSAIAPILPAVAPNAAPGKDVTKPAEPMHGIDPKLIQAGEEMTANAIKSMNAELAKAQAASVAPTVVPAAAIPQIAPTPAQQAAQEALAAVPVHDGFESTKTPAIGEPAPEKRKRKPKRTAVDFGPAPESASADKPESQPTVTQNPPTEGVSLQTISAPVAQAPAIPPVLTAPSTLPPTIPSAPKTRTQRLLEAGNALADANLKPVEGIGGPGTMLRVFAGKRIGKDWNTFNAQEWADFLDYFEQQVKELGIKEMANVVRETVAGA